VSYNLQAHDGLPPSWYIDVVAIELDARGPARMTLIEDTVGDVEA